MASPTGTSSSDDHSAGDRWEARVTSGSDAYREQEARLLRAIESCDYPDAGIFAIRLAFEEAMMNAYKHGGGSGGQVSIRVDVTPGRVEISVDDHGPGFDPDSVPDPLADENLELPSGRGLMLMRQYMTRVTHNDRGNKVTMVYERH